MKVGDLIKVVAEGDGILITPEIVRHGQLGVIIALYNAVDVGARIMMMDGSKVWLSAKRLEVIDESR
jgi:ABC-type uncharacterized transport system ATPase component